MAVTSAVPTPKNGEDEVVKLTNREVEVLSQITQGRSSSEVAKLLFVSKRTVDFHLTNVYDKLHVTNRLQAYLASTKLGLI